MTLNLTWVGRDCIVQASDRRFTWITPSGAVEIVDDDANKAVILSCSDALLTVTFTGLGALLPGTRVDEWLVEILQNQGACELEASDAVAILAQSATDWFRSFRSSWSGEHTFAVAGWQQDLKTQQYRSRVWCVTNAESPAHSTFAVTPQPASGCIVTGYLPAFTRPERRRIQAAARNAKCVDDIERSLVQSHLCGGIKTKGDSSRQELYDRGGSSTENGNGAFPSGAWSANVIRASRRVV